MKYGMYLYRIQHDQEDEFIEYFYFYCFGFTMLRKVTLLCIFFSIVEDHINLLFSWSMNITSTEAIIKEDKQTDAHKNINSFATGNILG